jgi:pimeloyl-ACP methyl ester carboxylesterase/DNA-binding CsgD family transcriptional regulator
MLGCSGYRRKCPVMLDQQSGIAPPAGDRSDATPIKQRITFCRARDGTRIARATIGKGPPLISVTPWLSHVEFDARSPVWIHWLRELSRNHTYIRYDRRGCGLSDRVLPALSFDAWLDDLQTVADDLNLKRFALLGMSHGGAVAIAYAARHPERVSHLVLLGACARGELRRDHDTQVREEAEMLVKLVRVGWGRDNPAIRQLFTTMFLPEATLEQQRSFNDLQLASASPETAATTLEILQQLDVTSLVEAVRVPTLVLHARGDGRVPFEAGRYLAALMPAARFVPLASRNHVLMEAEPAWNQFVTELREFLADGTDTAHMLERLSADMPLTPAETQVLGLIARGLDNAAIAAKLGKREKTVRNQVSSILGKLRVRTRAEAIALARDAGIGGPV